MTTINDTSVKHMAAQTFEALTSRNVAITTAERTGDATVEQTRWDVFETNVAAYRELGQYLTKSIVPKLTGDATSTAISAAFSDKSSGLYLTPEERKEAPTVARMSRALIIARVGTPERVAEYRSASQTDAAGKVHTNSAKVEDLAVWLGIVETGRPGNGSTVDVDAMSITGKSAKSRKVGPLRRKSGTARTSTGPATSATVVGFFSDLLTMSADDLAKIVADGPDISGIPSARLRDVARSCMARATMEEMSEKLVVTI